VVKINGEFRKIVSFSYDYSYGSQSQNRGRIPITSSVLASGNWFKFKIERTGIHRIDRAFLNDLGLNPDGIDPRTLKIYGDGGKPLPLLNKDNTSFDLNENAIQVVGEEDGRFDANDFVLFYGINVDAYDARSFEENGTNLNPYSDDAYYYITAGGSPGLRVQPMVEPTLEGIPITKFHDVQIVENDEFSPAKVGRRWFGNRFDIEDEQQFEFTFPNMLQEPMRVRIRSSAAGEVSTSMNVSINSSPYAPLVFGAINDPLLLTIDEMIEEIQPSGDNVTVDLTYVNGGNPRNVGYLDYIQIEGVRRLEGVDGQLLFRNREVATLPGVGEYQIGNASQFTQVWDVTNGATITFKENEGGANFSFKANLGEERKYVAVNPNDYFVPIEIPNAQVANQNIKGTIFNDASGNFQDIDYIIITAPFLIQPALRLANHHKNVTGLNVKVVTTDKIYEEFSSGKQDIVAIRNLIRYVYENASSPDKRIKYIGILGDTSVDHKNRLSNNNNIVSTYHDLNSRHTLDGFMSDDFFGMMDVGSATEDGDGYVNPSDILDIAVGRMLASDVAVANTVIDKTINYSLKPAFGNWRTNLVLISDDVDEVYEFNALERTLDAIGDQITEEKPYVNVKKIHTDAFQQETSAGGDRYPKVNEEIVNSIELGALIVNYFGHGGEDGLAKEFIYTQETAVNLRNENRYPCIVTVTCEFTKFDNPLRVTAGELTYWNPDGGAVSLITTTRSITVSTGVVFNQLLASELYGFGLDIPLPPAVGLMNAKNDRTDRDKHVVFFSGDPAPRRAFPKQSVRLTTLNGQPISSSTVVLEALSRVTMGGEVLDESGNVLTNYSGVLEAKVFDKNVQRQTLGNDLVRGTLPDGTQGLLVLDFVTLGEGLFNGQASVLNGQFEFEFVVPRDIQIPVGNGKVSLYAQRNGVLEDQTGFNLDIKVGGLDETAPEDNIGPEIQLFMNDESFVTGGITNDSPNLIVKLEDEHGINTASGIGHDLIAILDGDESNPFVLNEYYQADVDDFTKGVANYKLRNLEEGLHTLSLKAWDVYNNSSTSEIQFVVFGNDELEIQRVLNYPNPFVSYTEFWFQHNRPTDVLDVQVQIFTITGKIVKTLNQTVMTDGGLSREVVWDGTEDFGERIGKGVYVYKLTVRSSLINQQVEKYEKLVIL
jgi:hypothetical protein